ncbi:MAG: PP2C family serine/threonine-protein phosphatase [Pyrinomonadaceae bacterium]
MDNNAKILSASVSDRGLSEKRPQNEDSFLEIPDSGIFAVADGVGGAQAGEVASQMAVEILAEAFTNRPEGTDAESVMREAIDRSNSAIFQMAHELPQLATMATTIVALHLDGNVATIGHVGDSRLYRVDRDGNLHRETDDHSMVAEEVRAGRMTEEQAENHPSRNVISRALGAEPTVSADLKTIMIEPGTAFLICSDGITRHVADQEIKGVLTFGGDPDEVCDYLKRICYERGAEDNLTAVVVKFPADGNHNGKPADGSEETTIATPRINFEDTLDDADDGLLELDTAGPGRSNGVRELEELDLDGDTSWSAAADTAEYPYEDAYQDDKHPAPQASDVPAIVPVPVAEPYREADLEETHDNLKREETFSRFSDSHPVDAADRPDVVSKIATIVGLVLLGGLLGFAAYHLFFRPAMQNPLPALSQMESGNQQLSAFEENRRTVDKMPAEAMKRFAADPRDAEDYFLVGRSHLLLGQYPEAKRAFIESRARIAAGDVDQNNRKTIETEIALAMAVLNDTTVQTIFRSQLDSQGVNSGPAPTATP